MMCSATVVVLVPLIFVKGASFENCLSMDDFYDGQLTGHTLRRFNNIGLFSCLRECSKRRSCTSINYNIQSFVCEVNYDNIHVDLTQNFKYITRSEMNKYTIPGDVSCSPMCDLHETCEKLHNGEGVCIITECSPIHYSGMTLLDHDRITLEIGSIIMLSCDNVLNYNSLVKLECQITGDWEPIQSSPAECYCLQKSYKYNVQLDKCFGHVNQSMNYFAAEDYCKRTGGHLPTLLSAETIHYAFSIIQSMAISHTTGYWIDGVIIRENHMMLGGGERSIPTIVEYANVLNTLEGCVFLSAFNPKVSVTDCEEKRTFLCEISL